MAFGWCWGDSYFLIIPTKYPTSTIEGKKEGQKEGRDEEGGRKKDKGGGKEGRVEGGRVCSGSQFHGHNSVAGDSEQLVRGIRKWSVEDPGVSCSPVPLCSVRLQPGRPPSPASVNSLKPWTCHGVCFLGYSRSSQVDSE